MPLRTRRPLVTAAAALVVSGLLAGCGPDARPQAGADPAAPRSAAAHRRSATPVATSPATTAAATPSPTAGTTPSEPVSSAAPPTTLPDRLLPAADVPGLHGSSAWTDGTTSSREPAQPFGTCQKFAMTSIGAMRVAVRDYRPTTGGSQARAGELVAEFADPDTAARAFAVLESWRAQCDSRLKKYAEHHVGQLQDVPVEDGTGEWYLLDYGPVPGAAGSSWFDAQGFVRVQNRIALVSLAEVAKHDDYPNGQEPMVAAVRAAALRLP